MSENCMTEKCNHKCDADDLVFTQGGQLVYCMVCMHRVH